MNVVPALSTDAPGALSRIAEIQRRFEPARTAPPEGAAFDDALASAMSESDSAAAAATGAGCGCGTCAPSALDAGPAWSGLGASPAVSWAPYGATATNPLAVQGSATRGNGVPSGAPYAELFTAAGQRHGVDPGLLAAVARIESGFNPTAVSPAGAQGLMQFMPGTAAGLGIDPLDPAQAIDGAARYLKQQISRFGSVELGLAAYNAGPGAVSRHGGIPPYAETQRYVQKVMQAWESN